MEKNNGYLPFPKNFTTRSIHVGQEPEQWKTMDVIPPITTSISFKQYGPGDHEEFVYSRGGNPSRKVLEVCLANLENAKYALTFASGLGAISATVSLLKSGEHFLCGAEIYGGSNRNFTDIASNYGYEMSYVDTTNLGEIEKAIRPNTKLLYIESPTNPKLIVTDIRAVANICKKHKILFAIDNSFLTPYLQRPLELGADLAVYSVTKFINGHVDVLMGSILTNDDVLFDKLGLIQRVGGGVSSPFDCYQVNRSLKTLALRMKQHCSNGLAVAKFLATHPKVAKVIYPGLESHPQHEISKRQTSGSSGMVSFYHHKGLEESKKFLKALKIFVTGGSLGGCTSLIALPCIMTHGTVPKEKLKELEISENFIRISVGIEDEEELIADLKQALDHI